MSRMERPTSGQLAVAAILGLVFGALGGGFAAALELFLTATIAVGVWQAVTLLAVIADRLDGVELDYPGTATTVPMNRSGGYRR